MSDKYIRDKWVADGLAEITSGRMTREEVAVALIGAASVFIGTYPADQRRKVIRIFQDTLKEHSEKRAADFARRLGH